MSELAFCLFDRWGNLKAELRNHPIKKGTGIWGEELDEGKFLLIEELTIDENHRRKGYGRKLVGARFGFVTSQPAYSRLLGHVFGTNPALDSILRLVSYSRDLCSGSHFYLRQVRLTQNLQVEQTWAKAQEIAPDCKFAFAWATYLNTRDVEDRGKKLSPKDRELFYQGLQKSGEDFWRAIGFRRVGSSPYFCMANDSTHPSHSLSAKDDYRRPLVLSMPFAAEAKASRNLEGETPLECLEAGLESGRLKRRAGFMTIPVSDRFCGFAPNDVECLRLLKGIENPLPHQLAQLTYGCTCGQCLEGFMSPRVAFALLCQGELLQDMLGGELPDGSMRMSPVDWFEYFDHTLEHLTPGVRKNMQTNKSIRQGFTNIFGYVAETLRTKKTPITPNILELAASEWPPCTKNFIQRGGTVAAVVLACFDCAIDQDLYLGDGTHHEMFSEDIGKLPACRNDGEFALACRRYRALEGLPPAVDPTVGMGGLW